MVLTGFVGAVGYSMTLRNESLHVFWNPFYVLSIPEIVAETVGGSFWVFPASAIVWSVLILAIAIALPEGEKGLARRVRCEKAL